MMDIRKKLIISADDFGISPEANANILFLAKAGKIDRVAVMIDEKFTSKEIRSLAESDIKIDLHLDLPRGAHGDHHVYGRSALKRSFIFILKYFLGKISVSQIENDWERQIKKFEKTFGRKPDGLNSHQHIHYFPAYFQIFLRLSKKHKIRFVRFGSQGLLDSNNAVYRILKRLQKKNQPAFQAAELHSCEYMASLDWLPDFDRFLSRLPAGETELVCHPERKSEFEILNKHF
jgi:predicted glycoside hydrolase/deacetylase ChbG (UPF0249 family)